MFWIGDENTSIANVTKLLKLLKTFNVYKDPNNNIEIELDADDDDDDDDTDQESSLEKAILQKRMPAYKKGIVFRKSTLNLIHLKLIFEFRFFKLYGKKKSL